jgi:2-hydroxy-6-oxonona-2,4-dienedioate hydrolase
MGGSHIGTDGDRYLMANRPWEGSRATRQSLDDPSRQNIAHYLRMHIDRESSVRDETSPFRRYQAPGLAVLLFKTD